MSTTTTTKLNKSLKTMLKTTTMTMMTKRRTAITSTTTTTTTTRFIVSSSSSSSSLLLSLASTTRHQKQRQQKQSNCYYHHYQQQQRLLFFNNMTGGGGEKKNKRVQVYNNKNNNNKNSKFYYVSVPKLTLSSLSLSSLPLSSLSLLLSSSTTKVMMTTMKMMPIYFHTQSGAAATTRVVVAGGVRTNNINSSSNISRSSSFGRRYMITNTNINNEKDNSNKDSKGTSTSTATTTTTTTNRDGSNNNNNDSNTKKISNSTSNKKVTSLTLASKKRHGKKITMVTAYDYPSAVHVDRAGIDVILVGDSCAMVELGYETTQPMTMDEMIHHCKAVKRGTVSSNHRPLLVGDMPLGSYEINDNDALYNAYRLVKEAGVDAIKLEGGSKERAETSKKIVKQGGIAVMGHVGLTPQAISVIGGFRAQGRTAIRARELLDEALRLQDSGCFAIVLECIPSPVSAAITSALEIPTIGIGAGTYTDGQVLVYHDLLGMMSHPHHEHFVPKFCKKYAFVGNEVAKGLKQFKVEVEDGFFPGNDYSPYKMPKEEEELFHKLLLQDAKERERKHEETAKRLIDADEYEALNLYGAANGNGGGGGSSNTNTDTSTDTSTDTNKSK